MALLTPGPFAGPSWLPLFSQCFSDYNECDMKEDDCAPGTCRNTFGSFTCSCDEGGPDSQVEYSGRSCDGKSHKPFLEWSHHLSYGCSFLRKQGLCPKEVSLFFFFYDLHKFFVCACAHACIYMCVYLHAHTCRVYMHIHIEYVLYMYVFVVVYCVCACTVCMCLQVHVCKV